MYRIKYDIIFDRIVIFLKAVAFCTVLILVMKKKINDEMHIVPLEKKI